MTERKRVAHMGEFLDDLRASREKKRAAAHAVDYFEHILQQLFFATREREGYDIELELSPGKRKLYSFTPTQASLAYRSVAKLRRKAMDQYIAAYSQFNTDQRVRKSFPIGTIRAAHAGIKTNYRLARRKLLPKRKKK